MKMQDLLSLIRKTRQKRKWSQQYLADKAGIALGTLYRLEAGKSSPPVDIVLAILEALDLAIRIDDTGDTSTNVVSPEPQSEAPWMGDISALEKRILSKIEHLIMDHGRGGRGSRRPPSPSQDES